MSKTYFSHNKELRLKVEELVSFRRLKVGEALKAMKILEYVKWNEDNYGSACYLSYKKHFCDKDNSINDVIFCKLVKLGVLSGEQRSCHIGEISSGNAPLMAPSKKVKRRKKNKEDNKEDRKEYKKFTLEDIDCRLHDPKVVAERIGQMSPEDFNRLVLKL